MPITLCVKCKKWHHDDDMKDPIKNYNNPHCKKCYDKVNMTIDQAVEEMYRLKAIIDEQLKVIEQTLEVNASLRFNVEEKANSWCRRCQGCRKGSCDKKRLPDCKSNLCEEHCKLDFGHNSKHDDQYM